MDYTADVWGKKEQDQDAGVRDWLKSFYSGKQDAEDIEITPELRERYNRYADAAAKQYVAEAPPNESNNETLGQSVLQNVTKAGLGLFDLLQRSGRFLNPYLAGPVQEAARHNLSQELGYGIAGAEELEKEKGLPPGLAQKIIAATSQMAVDIPAKYMNPLWGGVMIAEGALGGLDRGRTAEDIARQIGEDRGGFVPQDTRTTGEKLIDVAKGAGEGAVSAATLKGLGTVGKLAPGYARPLIEGGGFAGMAAAPALSGEPVDINDIISNALIGGFFGLKKRNEPRKTLGDFKKYVSEKLGRKLTLDENVAVSRAGLGALEEKPNATQTEPNAEQLIARAKRAAELSELQKKAQAEFGEAPKAATTIGQGAANRAPSSPATAQTEEPAPVDMAKPEIAPREALTQEKPVVEKSVEKPVEPKVEITTGKELAKQLPPSRGVEVDPSMPDGASLESGGAGKGVGRNKFVELEKVGEGWKPATFVTQEGDVGVGRVIPDGQKTRPRITLERDPQTNKIVESVFKTEVTDPAMLEAFRMAESGGAEKPAGEISVGETFGEQFKTGKFAQKPADMKVEQPEAAKTELPPGEPPKPPPSGKPYEPVMKVSGPALEEWKLAAKRNMVDPDTGVVLPQFESAAGQGFLERSVDFWNASPEAGLRAVETGELPPGTNMGTMWAAGYEYVNKLGNADMIRRFSEAKGSAQLSEAGSVLGSMGKYKIELTPVDALNKIKKEKKKFNEDVGESPLTKTKRESKIKNVENELNKAKKIDESKREEMKKKRLETKLKKFNWQIENDPQYRQKFFDEFNRARKELNAEPIPQDFKITENITLSDFLVAMQGKRTQRYRNVQEKKIAQLTDKILKRNFDRDPVNRTWIDSQTKLTRERVQKLQKTLNTLKEINAARSGEPSDAEIEKLMELYRTMQQRRADIENGRDAKPYGLAWVDYHDYINELKSRATKLRKGEIAPYILKHPIKSLKYAAGLSKALNAAYDNSYVFRQGFKTLTTNPGTWKKNAANSFRWAKQQYGGKHVMREIMADIVSQENYRNGLAVKAGLDFGNPEEPFPVSVSQNLPLVGHPYKASETMFAGQAYKTRMDLLNKYVDIANSFKPPKAIDFIAKKIFPNMDWGVDLTNKKNIQSLGKFINSLTGRGDIGKITKEQADAVNVLLFSGRFFKSNFDFLTAHQFQKGVSPFVRYQAAKNLMKAVGVVAGTMMLANFLKPGSAETDPLSSDFGKIKIGNTRFDITGGMASIVTLAARLKSMASKSTITGRTYRLNTGKYGARTGKDLIQDFIDGKLSPAASTFWNDIIGGQSKSTREKPTVSGELINLAAPLPIKNLMELLKDKNSAPILAAIIADGLGIGVNTYGGANKKSTPTRSVGGFDYTVK